MSPVSSPEFIARLQCDFPSLTNKAASNKIITLKCAGIIKSDGKNSRILYGAEYRMESSTQSTEEPKRLAQIEDDPRQILMF